MKKRDVIEYLHDVVKTRSRNNALGMARRDGGRGARLASYIEMKPRTFGVSIDWKAILQDLAKAH
jgi:hypothetical protein